MSMDALRVELIEAIRLQQGEKADLMIKLNVVATKIATLEEVLGTMDELAEASGAAIPDERPFGTGRAPRRDVMGAVKQAVRDYMEAKGLGPRLVDVAEGASILLGGPPLSESAARRALDTLVGKGEMRLHDERYATAGAVVPARFGEIADAAK